MTDLFYSIVNTSITAGILVLVVLLLRMILNKAPKWVNVLLWGLVAVRLILPFSIESPFSLIQKTEWVGKGSALSEDDLIYGSAPDNIPVDTIIDSTVGEDVTITYFPTTNPEIEINKSINVPFILSCVWFGGMVVMLIYLVISYIRIFRRIRFARHLRDNIYVSEEISSPFVFGIIKPRICLPKGMAESAMPYVIAHENAHIRRKDHWWKPIGYILLTIHWFNPLLWISYIILCRDIEMACDEYVVKNMTNVERADYSEALLDCSVNRRMISACPLAFGENNVKERIMTVLNYKKPTFWIIVLAIIACTATAVCFLTNPIKNDESPAVYIRHGIMLSLPEAYQQDSVTVLSPDILPDNTIAEFYQTAAIDTYGGWLFSIVRHSESELLTDETNSGSFMYFAHDNSYWYGIMSPPDLQWFDASDELIEEYNILKSKKSEILDMIMENNPALRITSNAEVSEYVKSKQSIGNSSFEENFKYTKVKVKHKNVAGQTIIAQLVLSLPKEWEMVYDYGTYEVIPFAEYVGLKNGDDFVGGVGFLTYDLPDDQADIPEAIFNQIAMGAMTSWNIHKHFDVVTDETSPYHTALTSVLYSSKLFPDGKERSNSGIVTYHPGYKMYFALEINDGVNGSVILSDEELRYIAESISWAGVETSDTGSDIANQSELFKKVETFLADEFHKVYDPYYEILDLAIFDWAENGNEATLRYTKTYQYWNRDPDTVDYIKAAKDDPERYEMMYNDYLAPKETNYQFKVILNGDKIELYSNESPTEVKWTPRNIADYIPKSNN